MKYLLSGMNLLMMSGIFLLFLDLVPLHAAEPVPYGAPINLATAKKVMAAAEAEAKKNDWSVVIAIVDGGGHLVLLERLDNTQWGSVEIAQRKALTAAKFRRPTRFWEERIAILTISDVFNHFAVRNFLFLL